MAFRIGPERRQVDHRELGREAGEFFGFRPNQQRADEEVVPGELVDDANADAVLRLRSAVEIGDEQLVLVAKRGHEILIQAVERLRVHRLVRLAPPDRVSRSSPLRTMKRSWALRPVCLPVRTTSGPSFASRPSLRCTACSTSGAVVRFQWSSAPVSMPWSLRPKLRHPVGQRKIPFAQYNKRRRPVWPAAAYVCVGRL